MSEMRYAVKDSVFTFLFSQPEYTRQLYLALHPEDPDVTEADCKLVTLERILTNGLYNDLGFQVRDKLILLVEAQSTFSGNIALRMLLYLAATYKEYIENQKLDLYGSRPAKVPRPELYVVYSGDKKDVPDVLRFSDQYEGEGSVEVRVKVLRGGGNDIVDQYVRFCQIADRQRKTYGRTEEAARETIRQCLEEGILAPFLRSRQKEVEDIMVTLFDQEKVWEIHDYNVRQEVYQEGRAEGLAEGRTRGRAEGRTKGKAEGKAEEREKNLRAVISMLKGLSVSKETAVQQLTEQFHLSPEAAAQKVAQYWETK